MSESSKSETTSLDNVVSYVGDLPDDPTNELPLGTVCVDIETVSSDTQGEWWHPDKGQIASVALWWPGYRKGAILTSIRNPDNLREYLTADRVHPLFHAFCYDGYWLWRKYKIPVKPAGDTKLLAKILKEESTSLIYLLEKYVSERSDDFPNKNLSTSDWILPYYRWTSEMKEYAINDVKSLSALHAVMNANTTKAQRSFYDQILEIYPGLVKLYGPGRSIGLQTLGDLDFAVDRDTPCRLAFL